MSTKAQIKTQAKTPTAPAAARIPQPTSAVPEHEVERPDIAAQLEAAARLGHSFGTPGVDGAGPPLIQRQEIPEEEEEELQLKRERAALQRQEPEEEEELMMKPEEQRVGPQGGQVPPEVEAAINRARGGGQPLDGVVQAQMGETLGYDFSRVRVHTDSEADVLNQQLQAKAFTTGTDIFFRQGEYNPCSIAGRELVAHELTHVVQQSSGRVNRPGSGRTLRPGGERLEHEAEVVEVQYGDDMKAGVAARRCERGNGLWDPSTIGVGRPRSATGGQILIQRSCGLKNAHEWHATICHTAVGSMLVRANALTEQQAQAGTNAYREYYAGGTEITRAQAKKLPTNRVVAFWHNGTLAHSVWSTGKGRARGVNNTGIFAKGDGEVDLTGWAGYTPDKKAGWAPNGDRWLSPIAWVAHKVTVLTPGKVRENATA